MEIPGKTSFWSVVYEDRINFVTGRNDATSKVYDSMAFTQIKTIPDDNNFLGGVKDKGKFSEGWCFEVQTMIKPDGKMFQMTEAEPYPLKGIEKIWYICADTEKVKADFMNVIIKLRLKLQHGLGLWYNSAKPPKKETVSDMVSNSPQTVTNVLDGYWILLQDWSTCSVKCGGGFQHKQLMCVPPKPGGKPCSGEAMRKKACNEEPCPELGNADDEAKKNGTKMLPPIIKMMPISVRPLRYDKCHLKESDCIYTAFKPGVGIEGNNMKVPSRIVMNEKSVSIYTDEDLTSELGTYILERTTFLTIEGSTTCFALESGDAKGQFCNMDTSGNYSNFIEEWKYDFNLFKAQCHRAKDRIALDGKDQNDLNNELNKKVQAAQMDVMKEKTKKIQIKAKENPINKVEKMEETAMVAIKKELNIDGLLEKEELERETKEQEEIRASIKKEKQKDECLIKSIKEKEIEDQFNQEKFDKDKEVATIADNAKKDILQKRQLVKVKIMNMRKRAERKKQLLNDQLSNMRNEMAGSLGNINKLGDSSKCFKPKENDQEDQKKIMEFCNQNFSSASPVQFKECITADTFCFTCCQNQIGEAHVSEREECNDKCDPPKQAELPTKGSWQWVSPTNKNSIQ